MYCVQIFNMGLIEQAYVESVMQYLKEKNQQYSYSITSVQLYSAELYHLSASLSRKKFKQTKIKQTKQNKQTNKQTKIYNLKYNNLLFKVASSNMVVVSPLPISNGTSAVIVPTRRAKMNSLISVDISGKLITTPNGTFLINVIQSMTYMYV